MSSLAVIYFAGFLDAVETIAFSLVMLIGVAGLVSLLMGWSGRMLAPMLALQIAMFMALHFVPNSADLRDIAMGKTSGTILGHEIEQALRLPEHASVLGAFIARLEAKPEESHP